MKKCLNLFMLVTALVVITGCGSKKKAQATKQQPVEQVVTQEELVTDTTANDNKEDYSIVA